MKNVFLKILVLILAVAVIVCTFFAFSYYREQQRIRRDKVQQANELTIQLKQDREIILDRLQALEHEEENLLKQGERLTTMIFDQASENLMKEVYPHVTSVLKNLPASFVISGDEMVGKEGCISFNDYGKLLSEQWTPMIGLPEEGDLSAYIGTIRKEFDKRDLPFPTAFYFRKGTFNETDKNTVIQQGFQTIVYCLEDENAYKNVPKMEKEGDIFYLPYLYISSKLPIKDHLDQYLKYEGGGFCSVSTRYVSAAVSAENAEYDLEIMKAKSYLIWASDDNDYYCSFEELKNRRLEVDVKAKNRLHEIEAEREELKSKKKDLDDKINNVYFR